GFTCASALFGVINTAQTKTTTRKRGTILPANRTGNSQAKHTVIAFTACSYTSTKPADRSSCCNGCAQLSGRNKQLIAAGANGTRQVPLKSLSVVDNGSRYEEDAASRVRKYPCSGRGTLDFSESQVVRVQNTEILSH